MKPVKVVVDTNVFISAFFHNDKSAQALLRYSQENKIKFCFSKDTNDELYYIFGEMIEKFFGSFKTAKIMERFGRLVYFSEKVEHNTKTNYSEDKSDNKFIDCCIDGNIKYLISEDFHIENVRDFEKEIKKEYGLEIKILSPLQFSMEMLKLKFITK